MARHSKANLVMNLRRRAARLQAEWGFDPEDGCMQVEGKGEAANRAYGAWNAMVELIEELEGR